MNAGVSRKANFTWNMIGSVFESALNFVLLIAVNRIAGEAAGGVFTLAFSHAQLMYYVGTLEVRPIHSTDVTQKYRFADYFSLRTVSCALMMLVCLAYVLLMDGDPVKKRVMLYICAYKMLDAFYDVFACMFQQHDRIEYSGKVSTVRVGLVLPVFIGILAATGNLETAALGMIGASLAVLLTWNLRLWKQFPDASIRFQLRNAKEILLSCFPLFISVFVMLYISNAPKYAINTWCSDVVQNRYSILFMPAFAVNLFSQFVLRPLLTPMARLWNENEIRPFQRNLIRMLAGLEGVTLLGAAGAWMLGIPVLEWLYRADLSGDRVILLWVMVYGGLNAVNVFLYDMIAVTRNQRKLTAAYLIAAAAVYFLAPALVRQHAMSGAITASLLSLGLLDMMLLGIMAFVLRKKAAG